MNSDVFENSNPPADSDRSRENNLHNGKGRDGELDLTRENVSHEHSHEQNHAHSHAHGHYHSPEVRKKQLNRLAKIIGHLQYVRRMIENDEDCADVLMQLAASKSALNGLGKEIINEHLAHCICHAIEDGDMEAVEEFQKAIQKYI